MWLESINVHSISSRETAGFYFSRARYDFFVNTASSAFDSLKDSCCACCIIGDMHWVPAVDKSDPKSLGMRGFMPSRSIAVLKSLIVFYRYAVGMFFAFLMRLTWPEGLPFDLGASCCPTSWSLHWSIFSSVMTFLTRTRFSDGLVTH